MSKGAALLQKLSGGTGMDELGKVIEATPRIGKAGLGSKPSAVVAATVEEQTWQEGVRRRYRDRWQASVDNASSH
jgi:hypothetical protein